VRLAACVSGGLKSRSARGHGLISKSGGNASLAEGGERYGEVYAGTKAKAGHSQDGPEALSWSPSEDRASTARGSLQGLWSTTGSYSRGSDPPEEPVGPSWGMVESALWRRRRYGSSPAYHGVCGRHGGEEAQMTQGDLVGSDGQVGVRGCDTRRRKGGQRRTQTSP
jgi:hypothetical protein